MTRTVVVTGAARGIGQATARAFIANGAKVVVWDVNEKATHDEAAYLRNQGGRALPIVADVTDPESVDQAFDLIESNLGTVSVLINNAGLITPDLLPAERVQSSDFARMLAVHLGGSFNCSVRALPLMKEQRYGRITMVSSLVGPYGFANRVAYSTAKEGVIGMMRALAVEGGPYEVTVNAVAPGWISSPTVEGRIREGVLDSDALLSRTPLGRWGTPADVGEAIAALAGPQFDFLTGALIPLDGGYGMCGERLNHAEVLG